MRLAGRTALITGATSPQGRAQALLFAAEGAVTVLLDPADADRDALLAEITAAGGDGESIPLDPQDETQWAEAVRTVQTRRGRVDILVNNAHATVDARIPDLSPEEWERAIGCTVTAAFLGVRAVLPVMLRQGKGSIVNVTSVAALAPPRGISEAQAAAAGALRILTKDVSADYAAEGIRCNTVHAGLVDGSLLGAGPGFTPEMAEEVRLVTPMRRSGTHEEIARAVLFLASDEASYVTGTELVVDGGYVGF